MSDSTLLTIVVGVTVFAASQYVLKLMLEPVVAFRKVRASVASTIQFHRARITNARADHGISDELKKLSASLRAGVSEILCYKALTHVGIFDLPSLGNVFEACRELNGLSHGMNPASQEASPTSDWPVENTKAIRRIGELLGIDLHS